MKDGASNKRWKAPKERYPQLTSDLQTHSAHLHSPHPKHTLTQLSNGSPRVSHAWEDSHPVTERKRLSCSPKTGVTVATAWDNKHLKEQSQPQNQWAKSLFPLAGHEAKHFLNRNPEKKNKGKERRRSKRCPKLPWPSWRPQKSSLPRDTAQRQLRACAYLSSWRRHYIALSRLGSPMRTASATLLSFPTLTANWLGSSFTALRKGDIEVLSSRTASSSNTGHHWNAQLPAISMATSSLTHGMGLREPTLLQFTGHQTESEQWNSALTAAVHSICVHNPAPTPVPWSLDLSQR